MGVLEKWRPVVGWEGIYSVSNKGLVRRDLPATNSFAGRILSPAISKEGHLRVMLQHKNNKRLYYVHRLVLEAFVGPCPEGQEGCHFPDINPSNNKVENLRWDTRKANWKDRETHGTETRGIHNGCAKMNDDNVREARSLASLGQSNRSIARKFSVSETVIRNILRRKSWSHVS